MNLLAFVLTAYGMTFIVVYGKIFEDIRPKKDYSRKWNTLFHCPLCMGFWCSLFLFCINGQTELFTFDYTIANFFICGWISAGTSYLISMLVDDFGLKIPRKEEQNYNKRKILWKSLKNNCKRWLKKNWKMLLMIKTKSNKKRRRKMIKWMLQPVRRCCSGSWLKRVVPAFNGERNE